jgi:hypothetical protein
MMTLPVVGRRLARLLLIAFTTQLGSLAAHAANIVYTVYTTITSSYPSGNPLQSDTVLGSITTNGTIGVLTTLDVVSWNLDLIDNLNAANDVDLTPTNSAIVVNTGGDLSASATGLSFNFSSIGEFGIQADVPGAFTGYSYFCFSAQGGDCLAGETIAPQYYTVDGVDATGTSTTVGMQPLNQTPPTPSAVPEPSTYGLVLTGLLGLGGSLKRKMLSSPKAS